MFKKKCMRLRFLLTLGNFDTGLDPSWLWSAVTWRSVSGESWITGLICAVSPRVDTLSTCKVRNKIWRDSLQFRTKIFVIRWVV
ncbi:hypothetical protein C0J52_25135 [Blattella germanica]|nr:hypothetical protein C0J52_25135 [Blattella germanica]